MSESDAPTARTKRSRSRRGSRSGAAAGRNGPPSAATGARPGSAAGAGRRGKFNANGRHINGTWFASEAEAERFLQLQEMLEAGKIGDLRVQVHFDLVVNNAKICGYRSDFAYWVLDEQGRPTREVIEDVKGMETPEFKIKLKLFNATQPVPLSIIAVKGKARHSTRPQLSDKTGKPVGSIAGWMDLHWKNRLPD